jgi:hypothetical protein
MSKKQINKLLININKLIENKYNRGGVFDEADRTTKIFKKTINKLSIITKLEKNIALTRDTMFAHILTLFKYDILSIDTNSVKPYDIYYIDFRYATTTFIEVPQKNKQGDIIMVKVAGHTSSILHRINIKIIYLTNNDKILEIFEYNDFNENYTAQHKIYILQSTYKNKFGFINNNSEYIILMTNDNSVTSISTSIISINFNPDHGVFRSSITTKVYIYPHIFFYFQNATLLEYIITTETNKENGINIFYLLYKKEKANIKINDMPYLKFNPIYDSYDNFKVNEETDSRKLAVLFNLPDNIKRQEQLLPIPEILSPASEATPASSALEKPIIGLPTALAVPVTVSAKSSASEAIPASSALEKPIIGLPTALAVPVTVSAKSPYALAMTAINAKKNASKSKIVFEKIAKHMLKYYIQIGLIISNDKEAIKKITQIKELTMKK